MLHVVPNHNKVGVAIYMMSWWCGFFFLIPAPTLTICINFAIATSVVHFGFTLICSVFINGYRSYNFKPAFLYVCTDAIFVFSAVSVIVACMEANPSLYVSIVGGWLIMTTLAINAWKHYAMVLPPDDEIYLTYSPEA